MTSSCNQAAGFVMPDQPHYLDHIGIVCIIMQIPLLCMDESDYQLAKKLYPGIQAERVDYLSFTPEYLIAHYDVIFNTDLWDRDAFKRDYQALEAKYNKRFRVIHCPHGFSDKGFYLAKSAKEDITLIYGQNMLDQMEHEGILHELQHYVLTGNYRYTYYKQHQTFYDQVVQEEILSQFERPQSTILYAPTWTDYEDSTTFFEGASELFDALPDHYNLIVKLHPRLEDQSETVGDYYRILGKYDHKPNLLFLREYPAIYSLLAHTDIYIGDMSSIGYDFLTFNKPMFFLNRHRRNSEEDRRSYLFRCGIEVHPEEYSQIFSMIEESLSQDQERFSKIRREVYSYTFGKELPFDTIREAIWKAALPA